MTSKTPVKILVTNLERIITEKTLYTNDIKKNRKIRKEYNKLCNRIWLKVCEQANHRK